MRIQFGIADVIFNPLASVGNPAGNPTPIKLATLQDLQVEFSATIKDLRGQAQFPDDTAISDKKITWKSGTGRFDIDAFNNVFFGESIATGGLKINSSEAHSVPAVTPFTVTVTSSAT